MADEGITIYYLDKQFFDFQKTCDFLGKTGLHIRHPETQLIVSFNLAETKQEKVREMIYSAKYFGIDLWLESGYCVHWSFSQQNDYFREHFSITHLEELEIKKISKAFMKFAIQELTENAQGFLGLTLDQNGITDHYDFGEIFERENQETLSSFYISDITFLPKDKTNRITLDNESKIIQLNQNFNCIAKNEDLADYLKTLLQSSY